MMINLMKTQNPLIIGITVYLIIAVILYIIKPAQLFDRGGNMKKFGSRKGETCLSYHVVLILSSILVYFIISAY